MLINTMIDNEDTNIVEMTPKETIFASESKHDPEKRKAYRVLRFGIWVRVDGMGPVSRLFLKFLYSRI